MSDLTSELIPSVEDASVVDRLGARVASCERLRAGVAFYTGWWGAGGADNLVRALQNGFIATDLQLPTDIDRLARLARAITPHSDVCESVRLHLLRVRPPRGRAVLEPKLPPFLMHTKMLLFDDGDAQELWVGSHNWTSRALAGPNFEASLVMRGDPSHTTMQDAAAYLTMLEEETEPFDQRLIPLYKMLQGQKGDTVMVLRLGHDEPTGLANQTVTLFGTHRPDLKYAPGLNGKLLVEISSRQSETRRVFEGLALQQGYLEPGRRTEDLRLNFGVRHHAFRRDRTYPEVRLGSSIGREVVDTAQYFFTVELGVEVPVELTDNEAEVDWAELASVGSETGVSDDHAEASAKAPEQRVLARVDPRLRARTRKGAQLVIEAPDFSSRATRSSVAQETSRDDLPLFERMRYGSRRPAANRSDEPVRNRWDE